MKVTLAHNYGWDRVKVEPEERGYAPDFVIDMKPEEVMEILNIQVKMEALQQRLAPLFAAAVEADKARREAEAEAKKLADLEAEGEELPTSV